MKDYENKQMLRMACFIGAFVIALVVIAIGVKDLLL
jgi:hypothetical protein